MQRNLETQTRPEVTPFINTQTAARSRTFLCLCVVQSQKREREKPYGVYRGNFRLVVWPHLCVCFQPKGEVSQDMRYPICLIRHLFLNRPHLHSLPRSIHKKNTDCKRRLALKKIRPVFLLESSHMHSCPSVSIFADRRSCRCVLRNEANIEPYNVQGPQTCLYGIGTHRPAWKRSKLKISFTGNELRTNLKCILYWAGVRALLAQLLFRQARIDHQSFNV